MKFIYLIIVLSGLTTNFCCVKLQETNDNSFGLPNASQKGLDIFACRISDQNFISFSGIRNIGAVRFGGNDSLSVAGSNQSLTHYQVVAIKIRSHIDVGQYSSDNKNVEISFNSDSLCLNSHGSNYTSLKALVTISKYDTINKIVSGKFEGIIPRSPCDTLILTEGRFDCTISN